MRRVRPDRMGEESSLRILRLKGWPLPLGLLELCHQLK
jgi:hypothetical protein